jgi:hypothetical protein
LHCVLEDFDKLEGGAYYSDCAVKKSSEESRNEEVAEKLWKVSMELVGVKE